jgi:hypothetical protein
LFIRFSLGVHTFFIGLTKFFTGLDYVLGPWLWGRLRLSLPDKTCAKQMNTIQKQMKAIQKPFENYTKKRLKTIQ